MKYNKIKIFFNYFIIFISAFLIFATFWIINTYNVNTTIDAIIFHLTMPLLGVNTIFYKTFFIYVILPSIFVLICSICFFIPTIIVCIIVSILIAIFGFDGILGMFKAIKIVYDEFFSLSNNFIFLHLKTFAIFILSLGILIYLSYKISPHNKKIKHYYPFVFCVFVVFSVNSYFHIYSFIFREYSLLYEQDYKIPRDLTQTSKPRNLILILAESMESSYWGGAEKENLIPNLYNLALKNIHFSNNNNFGGIYQVKNTSYTIAGTISYLCGVPLNIPISANVFFKDKYINREDFLPNLTCISDILKQNHYNQKIFVGYESDFAGSKNFFNTHNIDILDRKDFEKYGEIQNGFWGIKDSLIFHFAKQYLQDYKSNKPFALYLPTVDTHSPDGFVDKEYCGNIDKNLINATKCSDKIISDFISWAKTQDFYKNTTIIVLGDHLSSFSYQNENKNIYNVFINADFSTTPKKDLLKNRALTHFDITTLILDSIGFRVESFGLGRNPFYSKTLLEEYGIDELNKMLALDSKIYESFYQSSTR